MIVTKEFWTLSVTSPFENLPPCWLWHKYHYEYDSQDPLNAQTTHVLPLEYCAYPIDVDLYARLFPRLLALSQERR